MYKVAFDDEITLQVVTTEKLYLDAKVAVTQSF